MTATCSMTAPFWIIVVAVIGQIYLDVYAQADYEFDLRLYEQDIPWIQCPKDWRKFGIECIRVEQSPASFLEAETVCNSYGGHLIEIDGLNLNRVVGQEVERLVTQPVWIGFYRDEAGFYKWTSGNQGVEQHGIWASGQPALLQTGVRSCASVGFSNKFGKYRWSLQQCDLKLPFVCQTAACVEGDFRCVDGRKCVPASWVCDSVRDCDDGSDEAECGREVCGGLIDETKPSFQSPGYPQSYSRWLDCHWVIQAPVSMKIELQFEDFNTEELYDIVTIYDGLSTEADLLATLSGDITPDVLLSSTNFLLVQFKTDHSVNGTGFKVTWKPVASDCGGELKASETPAWITSPTYLGHVRGNLDCDWIITATSDNDLINLQFEDFSLSAPGQWIEIRDGDSREAPLIGRYSGDNMLEVIVSSGPRLHVHLQTDLQSTGRGFNFTYQNGCDINIRKDYSLLHSPGYKSGNQYPNNIQCSWFLAPIGQRETTLIIHSFHTELHYDILQIFNSTLPSSDHHVANLSGVHSDWSVTSTTGQFLLRFTTDKQITYTGWTIAFSFGCHDDTSGSHISKSSSYVLYGSSISYTCDTGYQLSGTTPRVCDIGGKFKTPPPSCDLINCGAPRELLHGTLINLTSRFYDGVAYYSCDIGFGMIGSEKVTCLENGWTEMPTCEHLECPKLRPLYHGRLMTPIQYHIYQRTDFVCSPGYQLVGYQASECLWNGSWSHPVPQCIPEEKEVIYCEDLTVPHGDVNQTEPIRVGHSVHVTCHHGYKLSDGGVDVLKCVEGGKYDHNIPTCIDIDECQNLDLCGAHTCVNTDGSFWCTCLHGYTHTNETQQFCVDLNECVTGNGGCQHICVNTNGSYMCQCRDGYRLYMESQPLLIDSTPLIPNKSCYVLCTGEGVENASVYYNTTPLPDGSYLYPTTQLVHCNKGWVPDSSSVVYCQEDGSWSHTVKCIAGNCGELDPLLHGYVNYSDGNHLVGSYGNYICDTGYVLHGNCQRYCQQGNSQDGLFYFHWTGSQPQCIAIDCGSPPDLPHGNVTFQDTIYGSKALYACERGFRLVGQSNRTCLHSGLWSTEIILCVAKTCSLPPIPVYTSLVSSGAHIQGSVVEYTCDRPGYQLQGPSVLECIDSASLPDIETSVPGQRMVAMATLAVTSGDISPQCANSSKSKIVGNLQDAIETLKQVCDNPDTFDLIIADADVASVMNFAQGVSEFPLNLSFTLQPRNMAGFQTPIDKDCALKIRRHISENIDEYRRHFSLSQTYTCPAVVQLKTPVLVFQEPVILCLKGEPFLDESGKLSCLVSQDTELANTGTQSPVTELANTGTQLPVTYTKTAEQSTVPAKMAKSKIGPAEFVPEDLSSMDTNKAETSTQIQPGADFDYFLTGTISSSEDVSVFPTTTDRVTASSEVYTTLDVTHSSGNGSSDKTGPAAASSNDVTKSNTMLQISKIALKNIIDSENTVLPALSTEGFHSISAEDRFEITDITPVDINFVKENIYKLETAGKNVETTTPFVSKSEDKTFPEISPGMLTPTITQPGLQGDLGISFSSAVRDREKSLTDSLSDRRHETNSTPVYNTNFTNTVMDQTKTDSSVSTVDEAVSVSPLEIVDNSGTNLISISSTSFDTYEQSITSSLLSTVMSGPEVTKTLDIISDISSIDVLKSDITYPSVVNSTPQSTKVSEPKADRLEVCQCDPKHVSVPHLPAGFHIYPGPVYMIRLNIHLTLNMSLEKECLLEVRKVIQASSQQAIDDLRWHEVCPDLPNVQITNTTGVLKIENNKMDIQVPFFIEDPTVKSSSIQMCGEAVQKVFKAFFETELGQVFSGDIKSMCQSIAFDSEAFDIPQPSWVCSRGFVFDETTGECGQCEECTTTSFATQTSFVTTTEKNTTQLSTITSETTSLPTSVSEHTTTFKPATTTNEISSTSTVSSTSVSPAEETVTSSTAAPTQEATWTMSTSFQTTESSATSITIKKTSSTTKPTFTSTGESTTSEEPTLQTTESAETSTVSSTFLTSTESTSSGTTTVKVETTMSGIQNATTRSDVSDSTVVPDTTLPSGQTSRTEATSSMESTTDSDLTTFLLSTSNSTEPETVTTSTLSVSLTTETVLPTDPWTLESTLESTSSVTETSTETQTTSIKDTTSVDARTSESSMTSEPTNLSTSSATPEATLSESTLSTVLPTTSGLSLCKLEAVDPALIKDHTDFPPTVPQTNIWFNGSLTASTMDSTCLKQYEARLIELLIDSELQLNAQSTLKPYCQDLGLHIRFTRVQLSHEANSDKIYLQLAVSLLAKTTDVTLDDTTNCASFIMRFSDFSYLMCLLNTTELAIHSWGVGEECDNVHLDSTNLLMLVDYGYSCMDGYQYVEETDVDGHKCVLSSHETTTISTSTTTTPATSSTTVTTSTSARATTTPDSASTTTDIVPTTTTTTTTVPTTTTDSVPTITSITATVPTITETTADPTTSTTTTVPTTTTATSAVHTTTAYTVPTTTTTVPTTTTTTTTTIPTTTTTVPTTTTTTTTIPTTATSVPTTTTTIPTTTTVPTTTATTTVPTTTATTTVPTTIANTVATTTTTTTIPTTATTTTTVPTTTTTIPTTTATTTVPTTTTTTTTVPTTSTYTTTTTVPTTTTTTVPTTTATTTVPTTTATTTVPTTTTTTTTTVPTTSTYTTTTTVPTTTFTTTVPTTITSTTIPTTTTSTSKTTEGTPPLQCYTCSGESTTDACVGEIQTCGPDKNVCKTTISYESRAISQINKGCEDSVVCARQMSSTTNLCTADYFRPYCVYCCDSSLCNEEITLLQFKGRTNNRGRKRRSVQGVSNEADVQKLIWNTTAPKCLDVHPPVFTECPSYEIDETDIPSWVNISSPTAVDNSGLEPTITVTPQDFSSPFLVMENTSITFTATDQVGLQSYCHVSITVRDRTPPVLNCPTSVVILHSDTIDMTDNISYSRLSIIDNQADVAMVTYQPTEGSLVKVLDNISVTMAAADHHGNTATCSFVVIIKPKGCPLWTLPTPVLGKKECRERSVSPGKITTYCGVLCEKGSQFIVPTQPEYTCTEGAKWEPIDFVPDCLPAGMSQCPVWTYSLNWTLDLVTDDGCNLFEEMNSALMDTLQTERMVVMYLNTSLTQMGDIIAVSSLFTTRARNESASSCPTLNASQIKNLNFPNACSGTGLKLKDGNTSVSVGCPDDLVLDNSTGGTERCWPCPPGMEAHTAVCQPCPVGKYRDSLQLTQCLDCPQGMSTVGTHSRNKSQCVDLCAEGEFSDNGVVPCTKCPQGQYQPSHGSTGCEQCPQGTSTPHLGSTTVEDCRAPCAPGNFSASGLEPCQPCPLHHYSDTPGSTRCTPCLGNNVTRIQGANSSAACEEINHCASNPCQEGSTCSNYGNSFTCQCAAQYTGQLCDLVIEPCDSNPCYGGGTCENVQDHYICHCTDGHTGSQCEALVNPCDLDLCYYGDCVSDGHTHRCVCYPGFTGIDCSENIDDCHSKSCQRGECVDLVGSYKCNCSGTGYTGQYCSETDPDFDSSSCEVPPDPCLSTPCGTEGHCITKDQGQDYTCFCKPGYSGSDCSSDVDGCQPNQCQNSGRCRDLPSGFNCSCPSGYSGVLCENRLFNYCGSSPCYSATTLECLDDDHGYRCYCKPGWTGTNCESPTNECDPSPCENNSTCVDDDNVYSCQCGEGFSGGNCQISTNHCEKLTNTCYNGGTCTSNGSNFTCECPYGFHGDRCQDEVDACQSSPCHNGDCVDLIYDFMCSCYTNYTGQLCDIPVNHCFSMPCYNQGTCTSTVEGFQCICTDEYTGPSCETKINRCDPDPCQNSGSCHDDGTQFVCSCPTGYSGYWCEQSEDVCQSLDPCRNGGTCINTGNQPICQCTAVYVGKYCEKEKSPDFDLLFQGSEGVVHTVTVETRELTQFSLCLWVRSFNTGGQAKIVILKDTKSSEELVVIQENLITISLSKDVLPLKTLVDLGDRGWHHVCLLWVGRNLGQWGVHLDGTEKRGGTQYAQNHKITTQLELSVGQLLYDNDSVRFQGEVTALNMRTSTDLDLQGSVCVSQFQGDLVSWVMFDAGSKVIHPSGCPGNTTCPPGYHQNCTKIDKDPPGVTSCPSDQSVVLSEDELRVAVIWDEPQFTDDVGIMDIKQTHLSGDLFTFGDYHVIYMAFDAVRNWAICSFRILVIPYHCKLPKTPYQATKECRSWDKGIYCSLSCADPTHYDFTETPPNMYICGSEGLWDPPMGRPFILPPCSGFNMAASAITGTLKMTGPVCSDDYKTSLVKQLENMLAGFQLCQDVDCVSRNIFIDCARTGTLKREADPGEPVIYTVSFDIPSDMSAVTEGSLDEAMAGFQTYVKQLDGFELGEQYYNISLECDQGQVLTQYNKCVNCGVGFYWKNNKCELCTLGTYSDQERQLYCTACPAGETTSVSGAYSASFCYKVCHAGQFMLDDVCEPCELGFYQDELGQTACKPCPLGQTTFVPGAASVTTCTDICGSPGVELTESGSCSPCEKGFYKGDVSDISCLPCPYGFTTLATGATKVSMCSYVQCEVGHYRIQNNTCEPCPVGTYSSDETCRWCTKGHTTLQAGSLSPTDCVVGLVNECATSFYKCPENSMCVDTDDYYLCVCETGYAKVGSVCKDNCEGVCIHGNCVKNSAGEPSCVCDDNYHGPDCSIAGGVSAVTISAIVASAAIFLGISALIIFFLLRKKLYMTFFKKTRKLIQPNNSNSKVHRSEHTSDFHAYAMAFNPTFEMSSERSVSIRQVSSHSHISRHRTSHGEVSYSSRESYF